MLALNPEKNYYVLATDSIFGLRESKATLDVQGKKAALGQSLGVNLAWNSPPRLPWRLDSEITILMVPIIAILTQIVCWCL